MELTTRQELTKALQTMVAKIAADLRPRLLAGTARARAERLHADEQVGDAFDPWTDLLARRAAVLWVLKTVYVRVLEDRGMLAPRRLVDPTSEELFVRLAPNLGPTAYLRWVFRDLAMPESGLADLFVPQPAEILAPSDASSRELIDLWRRRDPDTGVLLYSFEGETFDSRLMGDLYQDLDPVVKKRFALLQTPDFVLDFILDQTLTPAMVEWDAEAVRVLDPACGSGHFLLAALTRIVAAMRAKNPARSAHEIVHHAMSRVVGIDLNDYACALARARLVMKGLELAGDTDLAKASDLHPQVFWADGLEQIETHRVGQTSLDLGGAAVDQLRSTASMTRPEVRAALRPILEAKFHVVVGNPPYITEKDPQKKIYHREKIGKHRRYVSASGKYSLGAPFTERMMQLCVRGGWMGEITANSFMKREFGKALIEEVLPKYQLSKVVDTAGAYIPGHGTPTIILVARNLISTGTETVPVVMGKRGEPGKPKDPARGRVWTSVTEGHDTIGFENEFVSVAAVPRATLSEHPWSIGGGGAAELKDALEVGRKRLTDVATAVGVGGMSNADDVYIASPGDWSRRRVDQSWFRGLIDGEIVRSWSASAQYEVFFPYTAALELVVPTGEALAAIWPCRTVLWARIVFGGGTYRDAGRPWWEWHQVTVDRYKTPLTITFGEVATHNEFALDRGGKIFKQTAPVIKLPADSSVEQHLALLAQLNSSIACFWLKQVCQSKGIRGEGGGFTPDAWEHFFQYGGTKVAQFPLAAPSDVQLEDFGGRIDATARARLDDSARAVIETGASAGASSLRAALDARRGRDLERLRQLVALQEELDWYCYRLYGLDATDDLRHPADLPLLEPGQRPFEIVLARDDADRRAQVAAGEEPDEQPTAWFERHGWAPVPEIELLPEPLRAVTDARLARTTESRELSLLEQPAYKRRWYRPDHAEDEQHALTAWIDDAIEDWSKQRADPFTAREIATALGVDASVNAVVAVLLGRSDFDLEKLVAQRLADESVPGVKAHVYKNLGHDKRAEWEKTWALQHEEDRWEQTKVGPKPQPPAPPGRYDSKDFQKPTYWKHRGKLDVPKERFIAYTEAPGALSDQPLYGWAGWTPSQRARVLLRLDERSEELGIKPDERIGLLWGAWFLVPYVAWDDPSFAQEIAATVKEYAGPEGVSDARLAEWADAHALVRSKPKATSKARRSKSE